MRLTPIDENKVIKKAQRNINISISKSKYQYQTSMSGQIIMMKTIWKANFSSDDNFSLEKTIEMHVIIIIIRLVFSDGDQYHQHVFWEESRYKLTE